MNILSHLFSLKTTTANSEMYFYHFSLADESLQANKNEEKKYNSKNYNNNNLLLVLFYFNFLLHFAYLYHAVCYCEQTHINGYTYSSELVGMFVI